MDSRPTGSASTPSGHGTASPVTLRLLSQVHHPPARVLVLGAPVDAAALDARGYRVERAGTDVLDRVSEAPFDLVCEAGVFSSVPAAAYVAAVARALRPGGELFGGFRGVTPSALIHAFAPAFEVRRVDVSPFSPDGAALLEVVLVRR